MSRLSFGGKYRNRPDGGFSLIEIIVSMLLLGMLATALLPVLVSTMQLSSQNRDQVAATSYANAVISELRQSFASKADADNSCAMLTSQTPRPAPADSGLVASLEVPEGSPGCPAGDDSYPTSIALTITVRSTTPSRTLTSITTEFLVTRP